ncbi:hypothetical protein LMZ02_12395 [Paenibacillus macerans]|uniref:hypothetical protein n=1 Tax=Paenibacillus macerans TaxID=44252 RepID=UPI001F0CFC31|nr:hypothetical protein [Paenibacillus macerans]MEC0330809.1 hypothetical protein [Paenibacillus macerans]UMV50093.1 hypothetical protein LMZ02_12395 [Paenibacillus macerans]
MANIACTFSAFHERLRAFFVRLLLNLRLNFRSKKIGRQALIVAGQSSNPLPELTLNQRRTLLHRSRFELCHKSTPGEGAKGTV